MKGIINYVRTTGFLVISFMVLYFLNFFNYDYLIGYLLAPLVFVNGNFIRKNLDFDFLLLLIFSVIYAIFYSFQAEELQGKQFILIYAISPPTFYLLGKYLLRKYNSPHFNYYIIFGLVTLFSFTALISVLLNFLNGGFGQIERSISMFWGGEPVPATIMGSFLTFNMCIPALLITNQGKKGLSFNLMSVLIFGLSLICAIRLGSRTQLGIFLVTSVFSFIYMIPRQSLKKNMVLVGILGIIVSLILTQISFDLNADWLTTFADRMDSKGSDIASGGGRTERWSKSFEYLFTKPLGWNVKEFGYAHNLWLDVLRVSGFIPFTILVIYSIRSFMQIKKTLNLKSNDTPFKAQILIYSMAFFMIFMVEPIFEGVFTMFLIFCLFKGSINKYYIHATT